LGAENVLPGHVRAIREAFGVEPICHYGLSEMVANASQCPNGRLHIDEDFAAVELLPVGNGTVRIIGTSLANFATPFIRYDTGDLASVFPSPCGCGLAGRVLERIDGRQEDLIELSDGTRVGRVDHLFKDALRVAEAQVRQIHAGKCSILVVPREGFGPIDEADILRECERRFGDRLDVSIQLVESIARTSRGKLRLVVRDKPPSLPEVPA
jgi:phenylacetate-CoA ligase